jgi:hypothetical protein
MGSTLGPNSGPLAEVIPIRIPLLYPSSNWETNVTTTKVQKNKLIIMTTLIALITLIAKTTLITRISILKNKRL